MKRFTLAALLLLVSLSAFGDGKVVTPAPEDPVEAWRFLDVRNAIADPAAPVAIIEVGYFTKSGKFHHASTVNLQGPAYHQFLGAIVTVADAAYEATLTMMVTKADGTTVTVPDTQSIFRFRIAKYLLAIGELPASVTAEKLPK
jgi:hypothetical protein